MNARDIAKYLLEFTPIAHGGTPTEPCACCGDRTFYRGTDRSGETTWLCRSCYPLGKAGWRMADCWHYPQCDPPQHLRSTVDRWFVLP